MQKATTKCLILENVTTGSVHETATRTFTKNSEFNVKLIHTQPQDSGHGAIRRYRGWNLGQTLEGFGTNNMTVFFKQFAILSVRSLKKFKQCSVQCTIVSFRSYCKTGEMNHKPLTWTILGLWCFGKR